MFEMTKQKNRATDKHYKAPVPNIFRLQLFFLTALAKYFHSSEFCFSIKHDRHKHLAP
jgi:hypothetical protein